MRTELLRQDQDPAKLWVRTQGACVLTCKLQQCQLQLQQNCTCDAAVGNPTAAKPEGKHVSYPTLLAKFQKDQVDEV